jgi:hypothetical protein
VWEALEFDRRKGGLGDEKAQTEKRESKRQSSHGPILLFIDPHGLKRRSRSRCEAAILFAQIKVCRCRECVRSAQGFPALIDSVPDKCLRLI